MLRAPRQTPRQIDAEPQSDADWQAVLAALAAHITTQAEAGTVRLSVLLSHRFTRYLMLPWSDERLDPAQADAYLASQVEAAYGDAGRGWTVTVDDSGRREPALACAIDTALLEALHALSPTVRIDSVTPWWVPAFAQQRRRLPAQGWFAAVEPGALALLELADGRVQQLTQHHWEGEWSPVLTRAVRRQALRSMRDEALPLVVCDLSALPSGQLPGTATLALRSEQPWPLGLAEAFA